MAKTLLHLNYLEQVSLLVIQEKNNDYTLHIKVKNKNEHKVFREIDENAKERLVGYLITLERYYLFQEKKESGKTEEEIKWDESYLQLVQFIEELSPGYIFRWEYIQRDRIKREGANWESVYTAYQVNYNQLKEKKEVFILHHHLDEESGEVKQFIQWKVPKEELTKYNPSLKGVIHKLTEDEFLQYKQENKPDLPSLFEGFENMMGDE